MTDTKNEIIKAFREKFLHSGQDPLNEGSRKEWYSGLYIDVQEMESFLISKLQEVERAAKLEIIDKLDDDLDVIWFEEDGKWFGRFSHEDFMQLEHKPKKALAQLKGERHE